MVEKGKIKGAIDLLQNIDVKSNIVIDENIYEAIKTLIGATYSLTREGVEENDFQGWPIKQWKWGEVRKCLCGEDGMNTADCDDFHIMILEDDGMGYGANSGYMNGMEFDYENKKVKLWF